MPYKPSPVPGLDLPHTPSLTNGTACRIDVMKLTCLGWRHGGQAEPPDGSLSAIYSGKLCNRYISCRSVLVRLNGPNHRS